MKVTEVERKESTKHCCGNGCLWRDSAEHEEETEALIDKRIAQNNAAEADRANAGILANSRKGYWRIAASPILQTALSNRRLERAEFQFFYPYYRKSVAV